MTAATLQLSSCSLACLPRWGTPRTEGRLTYGDRVATVAEALGTPLMPWQRHVADVALEVDPATGLLVYREVVLTVPRQSGKTTLVLSVAAHRAVGFGVRQNIVYTAQTRIDARKKWEDEHLPILQGSLLAPLVRARKSTGQEAFVWRNGSTHGLVSATKKSGHGPTLDLAFLDEAFAHEDDRLEQAFRPAMITRPEPQLWVVSTAGTAASGFLRAKVDAGRRRVESGSRAQSCYFEWSAPDDADPLDPATWRACMPARGHTVAEAAVRAELDSMVEEHGPDGLRLFRRAYLNQWVDDFADSWRVIPRTTWESRGGAEGPPVGSVAFAVDAAWPNAELGAISVAGARGGELLVQVVEHRPGTSWMVARVLELCARHSPCAVVLDAKGPARHLLTELRAGLDSVGTRLVTPTLTEVAQASALFYAAVAGDEPWLRHYDQLEFARAVGAAQKRPLADAWTWARRDLTDISPLTSATLACWAASAVKAVDVAASIW